MVVFAELLPQRLQLVHLHLIFKRLDIKLEIAVLSVAVKLCDLIEMRVCVSVGEFQVQEIGSVCGLKKEKTTTIFIIQVETKVVQVFVEIPTSPPSLSKKLFIDSPSIA